MHAVALTSMLTETVEEPIGEVGIGPEETSEALRREDRDSDLKALLGDGDRLSYADAQLQTHALLTSDEERERGRAIVRTHRELVLALAQLPMVWEEVLGSLPPNPRGWRPRLVEGAAGGQNRQANRVAELVRVVLEQIVEGELAGEEAARTLDAALAETRFSTVTTHHVLRRYRELRTCRGVANQDEAGSLEAVTLRIDRCIERWRLAVNALVGRNYRLVASIANRFSNHHFAGLDIFQEGTCGLITAAEKYDPETGWRFSTYAVNWVRQAINRALADRSRLVRIPVHTGEKLLGHYRELQNLEQVHGRALTSREAADALGVARERIPEIYALARQSLSLDLPVSRDNEKTTIADMCEAEDTPTPEQEVDKETMRLALYRAMERLPDREARIVSQRYGLRDGEPKTLDEIARLFGLTRERVRQIQLRAEEMLAVELHMDRAIS